MHAVVVKVSIQEGQGPEATEFLRGTIVPRVSQAPGFVAGYWVRLEGGDEGNSVIVFESEDAARTGGTDQRHHRVEPRCDDQGRQRRRGGRERMT